MCKSSLTSVACFFFIYIFLLNFTTYLHVNDAQLYIDERVFLNEDAYFIYMRNKLKNKM